MPKRQPQRTCIGCRQTSTKRTLIRIVRTPEGQVVIDETGKRAGRGAYLCPNRRCWEIALKEKRVGHALKTDLTPEVIAMLQEYANTLPEETSSDAET